MFRRYSVEEEQICKQAPNYNRENSKKIDYINKINDKPWGKEYLAYQNKKIGIWILHVNKNQETSLHCHYKKDTILIPLSGCFKINLYDKFVILNLFETLYVTRNAFHGIHSYSDNSVLMEIEIYTEHIEYTDKNDLLRIKDIYQRDKNNYETSVLEREPEKNETMIFENGNKYNLYGTNVEIKNVQNLDSIKKQYDRIVLLDGFLYSAGKTIMSGSFIENTYEYSLLSDTITVLCFSNINGKQLNKVIYSMFHLEDLFKTTKFKNTGLTSGCFDIVHSGHINNLKISKSNCDTLFVCLSSDKQVNRLKGDKRPINNLEDRINMLINYDFVDYLVLYEETDDILENELDNIMNVINPTTWFKGNDYKKEDNLTPQVNDLDKDNLPF
jgi:rfaE bifunctional protein nucleotidyltransferase chain/domain